MIRVSPACCPSTDRAAALIAILLLAGSSLAAQSPKCNRAKSIVDEVQAAGSIADHRAVIEKLRTAHQLCPTLGDAWKLAYCSASALGDAQNARIYKDRAIFNGVTALDCPTGSGATAAVAAPLPTYVRQKHALVIGIGRFQDPAIPRLQYAAKDAKDFAALLTDAQYGRFDPENVTLLIDEQATRVAILNAVQQLFFRAREDDLVVMYVSSHGSPSDQEKEKGLAGIGYLVTYDTSASNLWVDALEYQEFARKMSFIKARRKVTFLDTCFSGQAFKRGAKALAIEGMGVDERTAKLFLSGEGTFVMMSSAENERSWESEKIRNGYFTYYLIEAFRRSDTPPTVKQVYDYVAAKVPNAVARDKQAPQHPQLHPIGGTADVKIGVIPRGDGPP